VTSPSPAYRTPTRGSPGSTSPIQTVAAASNECGCLTAANRDRSDGMSRRPAKRGEIRFVDCHVAGFPDNGLYASPAPGVVTVSGGRYANNGIANVRVSDGSEVRGVHVICDEARDGVQNMRGIRLREGTTRSYRTVSSNSTR